MDGYRGNAFQNCLWNALMSRSDAIFYEVVLKTSPSHDYAKEFADAHEDYVPADEEDRRRRDMDFHNNHVGRELFREVKGSRSAVDVTAAELASSCAAEAFRDRDASRLTWVYPQ